MIIRENNKDTVFYRQEDNFQSGKGDVFLISLEACGLDSTCYGAKSEVELIPSHLQSWSLNA